MHTRYIYNRYNVLGNDFIITSSANSIELHFPKKLNVYNNIDFVLFFCVMDLQIRVCNGLHFSSL